MVSLASLWAPILVAAVLVFVFSSLIHMVFGYHASDFRTVPSEDDVMDAMRRFNIPPGDYLIPRPTSTAHAASPEFKAKAAQGPLLLMSLWAPGGNSMGTNLTMWFVYTVVVGLFAAYVATLSLPPGADYRQVFRVTSTVAFIGYVLALWQSTIWYRKSVVTTLKSSFDGLLFGLLTGGVFGWLWP